MSLKEVTAFEFLQAKHQSHVPDMLQLKRGRGGGGEGVDRAFLLNLGKVLRLPVLCRNKTTVLNAFSQKQPYCFHNCFSFYCSFISICIFLFLVRDLRFNNISVISNGDLAQLRYLTTLWVISSFSTLIILIWLVFVVVTFTVQFVTYL